jgi:hypothetical protein
MEWQDVQNSMSLVAEMPILAIPAKTIPATKTRDRRNIDFLWAISHHLSYFHFFIQPPSVVYCILHPKPPGVRIIYYSGYETRGKGGLTHL